MPEAVIVSAARTPIGRAAKGSLVNARPDFGKGIGHRDVSREVTDLLCEIGPCRFNGRFIYGRVSVNF